MKSIRIIDGFFKGIETHPIISLAPLYFLTICISSGIMHGFSDISGYSCFQFSSRTLHYSPEDIIHCYGGMDIASYIRCAFVLQEKGLSAFGLLGCGTWPPGFSMLELFLIRVHILSLPLSLLLVTYVCWSIVLLNFYLLLRVATKFSILVAIFIPTLLLLVPFISDCYLWDSLLMPEPIATAIFLIAMIDLWKLILRGGEEAARRVIPIGLLIGGAIYMRAQFDLIFSALMLGWLVILCLYFILNKIGKVSLFEYSKLMKITKIILLVFIGVQVLILPYKIYMSIHGHGLVMASVSYIFESVWSNNEQLIKNGAGFFVAGGGNSMCLVAPEKCKEFENRKMMGERISIDEYKKAAFAVTAFNTVELLQVKFPYFWDAWKINGYKNPTVLKWPLIFNYLLAFFLPFTVALRAVSNPKQCAIETFLLLAIFGGATFFCWIVHFEARYILPFKLFGTIWVIFVLSSFSGRNSAGSENQYSNQGNEA